MRHPIILAVCMAGVTALAGCGEKDANATVERAFKDVNVVDETNLSDVMLTVADPNEAVSYFARSVKESPTGSTTSAGLPHRSCGPNAPPKLWAHGTRSPR
tara:strand:- start:250 stop:552 length:303 start_codon:yes stop_codon:yes gene_type:complete